MPRTRISQVEEQLVGNDSCQGFYLPDRTARSWPTSTISRATRYSAWSAVRGFRIDKGSTRSAFHQTSLERRDQEPVRHAAFGSGARPGPPPVEHAAEHQAASAGPSASGRGSAGGRSRSIPATVTESHPGDLSDPPARPLSGARG